MSAKEYRVVWAIEVDAASEQEAALRAQEIQRDPASIATVFEVAKRCECGQFHYDEFKVVDTMTGDVREH